MLDASSERVCLHITGYTVHFQSIDWEDLREGNVYMVLAVPLGWLELRPRGGIALQSTRYHILYIRIAAIVWGECQ